METVLLTLAALACPIGMGVMMWVMGKGMRRDAASPDSDTEPSLQQLRAEHERLGEEIERLERGSARSPAHADPITP